MRILSPLHSLQPLRAPDLTTQDWHQARVDWAAIQAMFASGEKGGYWRAEAADLFEDSSGTTPATLNGPVGLWANALATPVVSANLVTNGTFAADSDWTKGTGWAIGAGVATKTAGTASVLAQSLTPVAGTVYAVAYTITRTAGTVTVQLTGGTTVAGTARSAAGTYLDFLVGATGNTALEFSADSAFAGTVDNVSLVSIAGSPAIQTTTANKPYLRRTPTTNLWWADANTATSALTATFGAALGSTCTVARVGPEGVTWLENQTISTTYNIAPAFGWNGEVLVINRALTAAEKAIVARYLTRKQPQLGPELVTNGTFDNDVSGWEQYSAGGSVTWSNGALKGVRETSLQAFAVQIVNYPVRTSSQWLAKARNVSPAAQTRELFRIQNSANYLVPVMSSHSAGSLYVYAGYYSSVVSNTIEVILGTNSPAIGERFYDDISLKEIS